MASMGDWLEMGWRSILAAVGYPTAHVHIHTTRREISNTWLKEQWRKRRMVPSVVPSGPRGCRTTRVHTIRR
jgi:hypothetical protein